MLLVLTVGQRSRSATGHGDGHVVVTQRAHAMLLGGEDGRSLADAGLRQAVRGDRGQWADVRLAQCVIEPGQVVEVGLVRVGDRLLSRPGGRDGRAGHRYGRRGSRWRLSRGESRQRETGAVAGRGAGGATQISVRRPGSVRPSGGSGRKGESTATGSGAQGYDDQGCRKGPTIVTPPHLTSLRRRRPCRPDRPQWVRTGTSTLRTAYRSS